VDDNAVVIGVGVIILGRMVRAEAEDGGRAISSPRTAITAELELLGSKMARKEGLQTCWAVSLGNQRK
jgi:hypothetical protein